MKIMARLFSVVTAAMLSGCVTPIPIDNLTFKGTTTVKTDNTARIVIASSGVGDSTSTFLMPAGGTYVAMTRKSGEMPFNTQDQQEFLQSLRKELVRLGVVKSTTAAPNEAADMAVNINIDRATMMGDIVEYKLDITMSITGGGKTPFQRQYRIASSEKDSLWTKMNTNGAEAREKLAHLMLERLIPDIEAYALALKRS